MGSTQNEKGWEKRFEIAQAKKVAQNMTTYDQLKDIAPKAWAVRENARLIGKTAVGCVVIDEGGGVHAGCNVEHKYRSHDFHAETNAIGNMVVAGGKEVVAILIVAEREKFTPCGACVDWIFEMGSEQTIVAFQGARDGLITTYLAGDLMPHYPQ